MAYPLAKLVIGTAMKSLYTIRTEGLENIPKGRRAILAANHISFLDSFFIPLVIKRRVTYLAKAEYWDSFKTRWFFSACGQIPVRRANAEQSGAALDAGKLVLDHDGLLGIYPEGTRSPDGRLHKGRTGPARMAQATDAFVVPVGLIGSDKVMPKKAKLPRLSGKVLVRFGEPMPPPPNNDNPLTLRSYTDELMYRIRELSGQDYVDHYASKKPESPQLVVGGQ